MWTVIHYGRTGLNSITLGVPRPASGNFDVVLSRRGRQIRAREDGCSHKDSGEDCDGGFERTCVWGWSLR